MGVLRTLLVTRRYWPQMGDDAACRLSVLADGFRRRGAHPEIVAARYAASWPQALSVREVPLHRPAAAPRSEWSMARYTRALSVWLRDQAPAFDLLYADAMREEGSVVVDVGRRAGIPVVLRYSGCGAAADAVWWTQSRGGRKSKVACAKADAIIATRASAEQELLSAGIARERIVRIDNGFLPGPTREPQAQAAARAALSQINGDLHLPIDQKVLLTTNTMMPLGGLMPLVDALPTVLEDHPWLRAWLIGDGDQRHPIYESLRSAGVRSQISMPGTFGSFEELLLVSDLFVLPAATDGLDYFLPRVIGAGIPAAVADTVETRRLLGDASAEVAMFRADSPASIRTAIASILHDYETSLQRAKRARQLVLRRSFGETVEAHLRLFCRLTGKTLTGNPSPAELIP